MARIAFNFFLLVLGFMFISKIPFIPLQVSRSKDVCFIAKILCTTWNFKAVLLKSGYLKNFRVLGDFKFVKKWMAKRLHFTSCLAHKIMCYKSNFVQVFHTVILPDWTLQKRPFQVLPSSIARNSSALSVKRIFQIHRGILEGCTSRARPSRPSLKNCQNGTF